MKVKTILRKSNNDLHILYKCEFCEAEKEDYGYSDNFFFTEVIPSKVCEKCKKNSTGTNEEI